MKRVLARTVMPCFLFVVVSLLFAGGQAFAAGKPAPPPPAPTKHEIVVSLDGNGDFTDPVAALNSITTASAATPFLVTIKPGVYDIGANALVMKEHVDVRGSGEGNTTIAGSGASMTFTTLVYGCVNTTLSDLTLNQSSEGWPVTAVYIPSRAGATGEAVISRVTINGHSCGIMTEMPAKIDHATINVSSAAGSSTMGIYIYNYRGTCSQATVSECRIFATAPSAMGIYNDMYANLVVQNTDIQASGAQSSGVYSLYSATVLRNVNVRASGEGSTALNAAYMAYSTQVYQGSYWGDGFALNKYDPNTPVNAAGAQWRGAISSATNNRFLNCFDGDFNPIP